MLKLIIVDDELWIREGLKRTVDWQARGIYLAGEAENGRQALELLKAEKPDIVITDIRMPAMDGTELMEEARRSGIAAKIILISGFGDFEYAQKAVKLGAFDYILKPIEEETLLGIVDRCAAEIREERMLSAKLETLTDLARTSVPLARQKHLELCLTRPLAERELQPAWQAFGIDLHPDRLVVLSAVVHDWGDRELSPDGCALMRYAAGKLLEELLAEQGVRAFACPRNEDVHADTVVIVSAEVQRAPGAGWNQASPDAAAAAVRIAIKRAVEQAQQVLGIRMSAGLSGTVDRTQLFSAFREALTNCADYFVDGGGRVYGGEDEIRRTGDEDCPDDGGWDVGGAWQSAGEESAIGGACQSAGEESADSGSRQSASACRSGAVVGQADERDCADAGGLHSVGANRGDTGGWQSAGASRPDSGSWQSAGANRPDSGSWQSAGANRADSGSWQSAGANRPDSGSWQSAGASRSGAVVGQAEDRDYADAGDRHPVGANRADAEGWQNAGQYRPGAGSRQYEGANRGDDRCRHAAAVDRAAAAGGAPCADKPEAAADAEDAWRQPEGEHAQSAVKAELLDTALTNRMVHAMLLSDERRLAELLDEQEAMLSCWAKRGSALAVRDELSLFVDLLLAKRREHLKPAEISYQAKLKLYRCPLRDWKRTALEVFAAGCPEGATGGMSQRRAVDKALRFIHDNYQRGISLADVAETIYLNPSYFSRMFHDEIGEPLSKYLIRIRIAKAKELLGQTPLKIYEIADLVGYKDFRHFVRTFKEWEGITPTQFRNYGA
ncbi:response regulator [Paenibacillus lycopersici]|uniref:Response regulator n=1 Tax=Paenibacillus lycopersici TaxID=2704462 RepID=A0A6C0G0W7_9BACL|nr:response regulator [Paenibacillus lycopersici]QHT63088.1 response regulator [Paenibacillus lycopersici]